MKDFSLWLYCAGVAKVKYMDFVSGVYRVLPESASHFSNPKNWYGLSKSYRDIQMLFWKNFSRDHNLLEAINIGTFKTVLHIRTVNDSSIVDECDNALSRITSFSPIKRYILRIFNHNIFLNRCLRLLYMLRDRRR